MDVHQQLGLYSYSIHVLITEDFTTIHGSLTILLSFPISSKAMSAEGVGTRSIASLCMCHRFARLKDVGNDETILRATEDGGLIVTICQDYVCSRKKFIMADVYSFSQRRCAACPASNNNICELGTRSEMIRA
jgi:hypothetical protein